MIMTPDERARIDKVLAFQTNEEKRATIKRWRKQQKEQEFPEGYKAIGDLIKWLKGTMKRKRKKKAKRPKKSK